MADKPVPSLQIRLLGIPEVLLDNQPVTIHRRQVRMLLYFLACQREPVRRAWLSDAFWHDKPDQVGREALRDALRRLRQALPLHDLFNGHSDLIHLQHPNLSIDVREFEGLYQGLAHKVGYFIQSEPLPNVIYRQIMEAIGLWRSNELLTGIETDNEVLHLWLTGERHRLSNQHALLLTRLSDHEMASGDLQAALRWINVAAQIHEDDPDLQLRRMRCLEGLGRWGELMIFLDKVEALYSGDAVKHIPPDLADYCRGVRLRATPRSSHRVVPRLEGMLNAPDIRFVGRQDMLSELQRAFFRGGSMVLWGEAGGGKTRLVYQIYQQIDPQPRLLVAQCRPDGSDLPFEPIIDMLRQSTTPEDWQSLQPVWVTQISRLMPEVIAMRPEAGNALNLSLGEARPLLFQGIHELLLSMSRHQRLLFFLDDAQWADEATLSLLAFLANQDIFPRHGLLLLAARGEETSPTLEKFLSRSPRQRHIQEMPLPPMSEDEIAELVGAVLGVPCPPNVSKRMQEVTGGNPLLLLESLRNMLSSSSQPTEDVLSMLPITSGTHALVRDRLRTLPNDAIQVMNAAAVIGQQFSQDLLEQVAGLDVQTSAVMLELLVNRHLIDSLSGAGSGQYRFIHDIFREVILAELSPPRRYVLHTRIAEAMRPLMDHDPSLAAVVAQHFEAAGKPVEAFECWLHAGRRALRLMAPSVMFQNLQRAEDLLLDHLPYFRDKAIYDLYAPWMRVSAEQGNLEEAEKRSEQLKTLGQQRASALLLGTAMSGRSFQHLLRSDYPRALESVQQAILYLKRAGEPIELVNAYSRLATIYEMDCRFQEARTSLKEALLLSSISTDENMHEASIISMTRLAYVENCMGYPLKALDLAEESVELSRLNFYPVGVMRGLAQIAYACFHAMRLDDCLAFCQQGIEIAERYQYMRRLGYLRIIAARANLVRGHMNASWQHTSMALAIGEAYHYPEMVMEARILQGEHFRVLRDYPRAIAAFQPGLNAKCDKHNVYHIRYRLGLAMLQGGDPQGQAYIDEAYDHTMAAELASIYLPIMTSKALAAAAGGDLPLANHLLDQLECADLERQFGTLSVSNLFIRCAIAMANGDHESAEALIQEALEGSQKTGNDLMRILGYERLRTVRAQRSLPVDDIQRQLGELVEKVTHPITQPELRGSLPIFRASVLGKPK